MNVFVERLVYLVPVVAVVPHRIRTGITHLGEIGPLGLAGSKGRVGIVFLRLAHRPVDNAGGGGCHG